MKQPPAPLPCDAVIICDHWVTPLPPLRDHLRSFEGLPPSPLGDREIFEQPLTDEIVPSTLRMQCLFVGQTPTFISTAWLTDTIEEPQYK